MSVNKSLPHVLVLPEDDANRSLANGFYLEVDHPRRMQVLPVAGGWQRVLSVFESDHAGNMLRFPNRFLILLVDFDGRGDRLQVAKAGIPSNLMDRVFILGAWTNPEALKSRLGDYETIGAELAKDCRKGTSKTWEDALLQHNAGELDRLRKRVVPVLFSTV